MTQCPALRDQQCGHQGPSGVARRPGETRPWGLGPSPGPLEESDPLEESGRGQQSGSAGGPGAAASETPQGLSGHENAHEGLCSDDLLPEFSWPLGRVFLGP